MILTIHFRFLFPFLREMSPFPFSLSLHPKRLRSRHLRSSEVRDRSRFSGFGPESKPGSPTVTTEQVVVPALPGIRIGAIFGTWHGGFWEILLRCELKWKLKVNTSELFKIRNFAYKFVSETSWFVVKDRRLGLPFIHRSNQMKQQFYGWKLFSKP